MNPLRNVGILLGIFILACASHMGRKSHGSMLAHGINMNQADWKPAHEFEKIPHMDQITFEKLEKMSLNEGADLITKLYHRLRTDPKIRPSLIIPASKISAYAFTPSNQKISFKLNEMVKIAKEQNIVGDRETTMFITGIPEKMEATKNATEMLVQAYKERYRMLFNNYESEFASSPNEEMYANIIKWRPGNVIVVDFGSAISSFMDYVTMDVEENGAMMGDILAEFAKLPNVRDNIHIIGSNMGAHIAGVAGRHYSRQTGRQMRRITGLDPSKIFNKKPGSITGLARGDADFVDVIHTSAYGMGTDQRRGNVDFFPNGPSEGVLTDKNVIEASMRAVHYFAQTVLPRNKHKFLAVRSTSMEEYFNRSAYTRRAYMGMSTDYDIEGDFMLEIEGMPPVDQKQQNVSNMYDMHNEMY